MGDKLLTIREIGRKPKMRYINDGEMIREKLEESGMGDGIECSREIERGK